MTLQLWGLMQKAQDDPRTIEEVIADMIAEHEEDPEAHLGDGESLSMHKQEDVIDHPPGSILPDKWSFTDYDFETNFESLSGFTISSGVTNTSWPGVIFDIYDGGGDLRTLRANFTGVLTGTTLTYDYLCDTYFAVDSADDLDIIDIGISDTGMTTRSLGFRITGGDLYGVARWGSSEQLTSSLGDVTDGNIKFVRVYYDYGANLITFYLNGVAVATLTPSSAVQISNQWSVRAQDNGAEGTLLRVFKTYISRGL